ncbi:MAG: transglutaminase-like cysteine peptidase [Thiovulaceae bacterium]|nr:transglutaminase-like cysteine peptidase [Sulfurimonadaceae bacterium]
MGSRLLVIILLMQLTLHAKTFYLPKDASIKLKKEHGDYALKRAHSLITLMNNLLSQSEKEKLIQVNDFFNQITYASDIKIWGVSEYWANRMEFLGKGAGDCEDYTYAKYFTLKQLGIQTKRLGAFYCTSLTYNMQHMVLAYFKNKKNPFILDNYDPVIKPASRRKDLKPIKLYNSEGLFIAKLIKLGKAVPQTKQAQTQWLEIINGIRSK